jgi:hypothetical protein
MADCKIVYYNSSTSSIQLGDFLYQNQAQTIPAGAGYYAWTVNDKWFQTDAEGVVIDSGSCSPIGNIWTPTLISSILMGCISQSSQGSFVSNQLNEAYYTSSVGAYFVAFTGTGSLSSSYPAIQTTTASFQAYDFNRTYDYTTNGSSTTISYPSVNYDNAGGRLSGSLTQMTSQIWGAIDFTNSGSQNGLLRIDDVTGNVWSVYTEWSGSSNKLFITNVSQSVPFTTTMSLAGGNYPVDRLSLYTIRISGSNFQFLSGSTIIGNVNHQKQFNINSTWEVNIGTNAGSPPVPSAYYNAFRGYMNAGFLYTSSLSLERIEQNTYSLINGYTSSVNLRGCIEPAPNFPSLNGLQNSLPYGCIGYQVSVVDTSSVSTQPYWFDGYQTSYPNNFSSSVSGNLNYIYQSLGGNLIISGGVNNGNGTFLTSTASFEAYNFTDWVGTPNQQVTTASQNGAEQWQIDTPEFLPISGNTSAGITYQVWGAANMSSSLTFAAAEINHTYFNTSSVFSKSETWGFFINNKYKSSSLFTPGDKEVGVALMRDSNLIEAVSMSLVGTGFPMNSLSLFTFKMQGNQFSFYSGSTLIGTKTTQNYFISNSANSIYSQSYARVLDAPVLQIRPSIFGDSPTSRGGWGGFVNHQLLYKRAISDTEIAQNLNSFIGNYTSSIDKNNCYKPPITPATTTTTSTTTTTTTSTTTTTTSTSTTTTLGPQIITRGLSSYLNFRNFYSASIENNDLWYDSVQLVSESACSRIIGIDSADEGCGENRPDCPVYLTTGSFNAWDWPNVFNCNKSVFFPTGAFASSSNQTYVFYGAWDKDSNYGFVRNRNYQTSLQRANKIYSSGSNIVLETYWNNGSTHTLDLPITASTFTSSSLSMLTVRVENGNTASVFQNGNLILTKETSSLNFQSQNAGYTYWLDSDDVSDYTMFAHSMLIYTASLTNNEISALSTAINNNITGSY